MKFQLLLFIQILLGQNQLGTFVYAVNNENKIETRQVEIQYSNKDLAITKDGLNERGIG